MARWELNARGRLEAAALELFVERGFDQIIVAEIAQRAGLTERTFFRYFTDKREVLFGGTGALHDLLVLAVAGAPSTLPPLDAVAAGFRPAIAVYFENRPREQARQRNTVIAAHAGLTERELIKLSSLSSGLADALRGRGVAEPAASLAADIGVTVFKLANDRWIESADDRSLSDHFDAVFGELKPLIAHS
jgi:AcrR family transcriptional regulator